MQREDQIKGLLEMMKDLITCVIVANTRIKLAKFIFTAPCGNINSPHATTTKTHCGVCSAVRARWTDTLYENIGLSPFHTKITSNSEWRQKKSHCFVAVLLTHAGNCSSSLYKSYTKSTWIFLFRYFKHQR